MNILENFLVMFQILGSIHRTECGKLICFCDGAQIDDFFFKFFDRFFIFLNIFENVLVIFQILGSLHSTEFGKLNCFSDDANFFLHQKL